MSIHFKMTICINCIIDICHVYTSFEIQWLAQLSFFPVPTQKLQRSVGLKPWFAGSTGKTTSIANACVYRNSACLLFALY